MTLSLELDDVTACPKPDSVRLPMSSFASSTTTSRLGWLPLALDGANLPVVNTTDADCSPERIKTSENGVYNGMHGCPSPVSCGGSGDSGLVASSIREQVRVLCCT